MNELQEEKTDGVMVFYGLCGNVLGSVENDLSQPECLVRILKDEDGEIADDCICVTFHSVFVSISLTTRERHPSLKIRTRILLKGWKKTKKDAQIKLRFLKKNKKERRFPPLIYSFSLLSFLPEINTDACNDDDDKDNYN